MIRIPASAAEAIRAHGREAYPEECCGALFGSAAGAGPRVQRIVRLDNGRSDERTRRFRIDPAEYRRVEKAAESAGLSLLGFYHSHPDHSAIPSDYDREHALPFFHYLVVAVSPEGAGEMASWLLSEDRRTFEREPLETEHAPE